MLGKSITDLMRFMVGAEFAAPHLAAHQHKTSSKIGARRAA